jgi:hypothetical protein
MLPEKTGQLSYRGYNVNGGQVHINVSYLLRIIRAARNRQENERNIAALVRRRDRLAYDDVVLENFNAGEGRTASTSYRHDEFVSLRWANAHYEDFFFYQNSINRWNRLDSLLRHGHPDFGSVANAGQALMFDPYADA